MADLYSNKSSAVPAVTHRTYSDDGLPWPNRKADFVATLVPFLVRAPPAPGYQNEHGVDENAF